MLTEGDLQAVVDLVLEKEQSRIKGHLINHITVRVKPVLRGKADPYSLLVVVPLWALARSDDYAIYYTIHEVAHILSPHRGHGSGYKEVEDLLLSFWEMSIKRKRAYPRTVSAKGDVVYTSPKKADPFSWNVRNCYDSLEKATQALHRYSSRYRFGMG